MVREMKKIFLNILFVFAFSVLPAISPFYLTMADWSASSLENTAVCTASGQQSFPQIVSDKAGGAIIVWEDTRSVHFDIYAQRIDAQGNVLWMGNGIPVCTAPENQNKLRIISDGEGGVIITWQDIRRGSGNYDIYAQRIDKEGKPRWAENGVAVCTEVNAQNSPCIATDGSGGAVVIWQDLRTNYADLYAQRISKDGEMLWAIDGVLICGTSGAQSAPVAVDDGAGGVIVVWQDFRRSYADIYAQRVDGSGKILWDKNGVAVCTASGHESFPVIISNKAEGAVIAWVDTRNGNNDVFSQQLDGNGAIHWKENGVAVSIAKGNQNYPVITSDGAGGAYIAWSDMRSGESDIYIQRIDIAGNALWIEDGWGICTETGIQNYVNIDNDGAGGVSLVWNDSHKSTFFDVYAQWIDQKGQLRWGDKGLAVSMAPDTQCYPVIANDGIGSAVISWQDARNKDTSYWDIYAQKVNEKDSLGQR